MNGEGCLRKAEQKGKEVRMPKMEGRNLFNQTAAADGTLNEEPTMRMEKERLKR